MTDDIRLPQWINEPYHRHHTTKEETSERLATHEEKGMAALGLVPDDHLTQRLNFGSGEDNTMVIEDRLAKSIALDTERLRREDWVDRYHDAKASGEPDRINWHGVWGLLGMTFSALVVMAVVWWVASWLAVIF